MIPPLAIVPGLLGITDSDFSFAIIKLSFLTYGHTTGGRRGRDRMVVRFTTT